jgi:uncharacterized protein (DUF58 family)
LPPAYPLSGRSKIVLIGDFLSPPEDVAKGFSSLGAEGAEGHVVMIADPIEETFPFTGHTEFLEAGGPSRFRAPRAQQFRDAYLERLAAHREAVRSGARARGWDLAIHRTDQSAASALLNLHGRLSERASALAWGA